MDVIVCIQILLITPGQVHQIIMMSGLPEWHRPGRMPGNYCCILLQGNAENTDSESGLGTIANPANLLDVIAVGAVDKKKKIAPFQRKDHPCLILLEM